MTVQRYSSEQSPSTFRKECNHLTANFLVKIFSVYIPSQYKKKEEKTQHDISNVTEHIVKRTAIERTTFDMNINTENLFPSSLPIFYWHSAQLTQQLNILYLDTS